MTLPTFPKFKHISKKDLLNINELTRRYPPFSDYDFISLFIWDTNKSILISKLFDNLVIQFSDYISGEPFLSFLGTNKTIETINILLTHSKNKGFGSKLRLIPEVVVSSINLAEIEGKLKIVEDINNRDYILDVEKIANMSGKKLHQKRKLIKRFIENNEYSVDVMSLKNVTFRKKLLAFFFQWEKERAKSRSETKNELTAFRRMLSFWRHYSGEVLVVHFKNKIFGFTIFEQIDKDYAISAFQKGLLSKRGIYEVMNWEVAKYLKLKGVKYINIEQDLGILGLRRSKQDYDPTYFNKYIVKNV